ncbi:MAG: elongation factor G [bacterium]|nr:elongation factor G [bacterium]
MRTKETLRNIGIMAHVDAGKTTLTERILYYSGITHKLGNVDDGNTMMDTDPQESKRGITISSAAITTSWERFGQNCQINIIDTPGHVDFTAEVERSLRVLDGAVALFCAVSGVQPQSQTVWRQATKYKVPRLCFVNKMDREGADFDAVVQQIRNELHSNAIPMQIPIGEGSEFIGIVDLIEQQALYWDNDDSGLTIRHGKIPAELVEKSEILRASILESAATEDDELLEQFLENPEQIENDAIRRAIRSGTLKGNINPVYCGTAYKNCGVQPLLDAVVDMLPSPVDQNLVEALDPDTDEAITLDINEYDAFSALVFKVITDPHAGKIAMARIYSGELSGGLSIMNMSTGSTSKAGRIMRIHADRMETLESAGSGEIVALTGVKNARTGDTLTAVDHPVILEAMDFPDPVIGYAIEPKTSADDKKLSKALGLVKDEDPTLHVQFDQQTGQTILNGMGELHLEVVLEKLRLEHQIELNIGAPKVAYREQFANSTEYRYQLKKQNGGSGQFAEVVFEIGPGKVDSKGLTFVNDVKGGVIPREFIQSVEKGFQKAMQHGVAAGYPLESLFVRLFDGDTHDEDSHALDFEIAAIEGFKEAAAFCNPYLMEPIMNVVIEAPEDCIGVISSDLNRKRGMIKKIEAKPDHQIISADVPLTNLFKYIGHLRSMTSGRASASMSFSHYAKASSDVQELVLANQ